MMSRRFLTLLLALCAGAALWWKFFEIPRLVSLEEEIFWYPEKSKKQDERYRLRNQDVITSVNISPEAERVPRCHLLLDDNSRTILRSDPPTPVQLAYVLDEIRTAGAHSLVVSTPLSWEAADELGLRALEHELASFRSHAVGITLAQAVKDAPFPDYLENSVIESHGDASAFLELNSVAEAPSIHADRFGFRSPSLDGSESPRLVARWGERVLPSLELAFLMDRFDKAATVVPGSHIECGVVIPIDEAGRYRGEIPTQESLSLGEFLTQKAELPGLVVLSRADDALASPLADRLAALLSRTPRDSANYHFLGMPLGLAALLPFALLLHWHKAFVLVLPGIIYLAVTHQQMWIPLSPFLLTFLLFLFFDRRPKSVRLRRSPAT